MMVTFTSNTFQVTYNCDHWYSISPLVDRPLQQRFHHSCVRRYLTSEAYPGPQSNGKPWYGLLMLLRKYPEHFVINTRTKGRVTHEFVCLVLLLP
ncbi:hypothetical protein RHSIM_Rhsim01G0253000 [Rhododendron simsii]|uniref:Uncharacterized protein n=1 Tax=Rhododendron simsii TaxID=118357 RepID=A0A834HHI1_RHOSS|nr:hypothetical protein RHSIM_Rhsim01G0253000 [Rhododendron simsii]